MTAENQLTLEDFAKVITYWPSLSFSPGGKELAYSCNASGQFNLWVHPVDGGEPRQLTSYIDNAVQELAWSPDGSTILYTADTQGDEKHQLHVIGPAGGEPRALTARPDVQHYLAGLQPWSPDGQYIAYAGNDREPTAQDTIIREYHTAEIDRPLADGRIYQPVAWSPDGQLLTVIDERSNMELIPLVVDVRTGEVTKLKDAGEPAIYVPGPWKQDGSGFWVLTDKGQEFSGLAFIDVSSGALQWVALPGWDVEAVAASADGGHLAWSTNVDGYSHLTVRSLVSGEDVDLPELPGGVLKSALTFSPDGKL